MHKTYLNEVELQIIKGADKIVEKIGMFPAMETGHLVGFSARRTDDLSNRYSLFDAELIYDITPWVNSQNRTAEQIKRNNADCDPRYLKPYVCKDFAERRIKLLFHNCSSISVRYPLLLANEIKFGGKEQLDRNNRHQDRAPGLDIIIDRPYTCFYAGSGEDLIIFFDENECEISAELF